MATWHGEPLSVCYCDKLKLMGLDSWKASKFKSDESLDIKLQQCYKDLAENQESLGPEFTKILYDNLDGFYA